MRDHRKALILLGVVGGVLLAAGTYRARPTAYRSHSTLDRGQCTWYAFERAWDTGWHIEFDKPWGRHARAWWEKVVNAERGGEPRVGAVMVLDGWPGNEYGHVAYVEQVEDAAHWTVSHANMMTLETCAERDGVTIFRAAIEQAPGGVRIDGSRHVYRLRGFLYPKQRQSAL